MPAYDAGWNDNTVMYAFMICAHFSFVARGSGLLGAEAEFAELKAVT